MADPASKTEFIRENVYALKEGMEELKGYILGGGDFSLIHKDRAKYVGPRSESILALFEVTRKEGINKVTMLMYFERAKAKESLVLVVGRVA